MLTKNYIIIDREPHVFEVLSVETQNLRAVDASGNDTAGSPLVLDSSIYAALYCDEVRNVTLVVNKDGVQTVETLLWWDAAGYEAGKKSIGEALAIAGVRLSRQNKKLNRYGEEIAKKLSIGVDIQVIDAIEESAMVECPECGMMSPKGTLFCMDCGAELT